jgi:hypothetical protein
VLAIHHAVGTVHSRIGLDEALGGSMVDDAETGSAIDLEGRSIEAQLGPYGVRLYRLH